MRVNPIKVEALAQLGRMLKEMPKANGGEYGGKKALDGTRIEPSNPTPTLADMGLDKKTSKLAQDIADLPEEQFEAVKKGAESLSSAMNKQRRQNMRE